MYHSLRGWDLSTVGALTKALTMDNPTNLLLEPDWDLRGASVNVHLPQLEAAVVIWTRVAGTFEPVSQSNAQIEKVYLRL